MDTNEEDSYFDLLFGRSYYSDEDSLINHFYKMYTNFKHFLFLLTNSDFDFLKIKLSEMTSVVTYCNYYLKKGYYPIYYLSKNKYLSVEMLDLVKSKGFCFQHDDEIESIIPNIFKLDDSQRIILILEYLKNNSYNFNKVNRYSKDNILHDLAYCNRDDNKIFDFIFDLNINNEQDNLSPILTSSKLNNFHYCRYLINKGFNVNSLNDNNNSSLMYACMNSNYDLAKLLLENGANVNQKDKQNDMPIYYACGCEIYTEINLELVKLLIDYGAKLDDKNEYGHTPLHYACQSYKSNYDFSINFDVIKLLIKSGTPTNIIDEYNKTFIEYLLKNSKELSSIKEILNMTEFTQFQKNNILLKVKDIDLFESEETDDSNIVVTQSIFHAINEESNRKSLSNIVNDLNLIKYHKINDDIRNCQCIICYDNICNKRAVFCEKKHCFHESCSHEWIKESKNLNCPLCTNEMNLTNIYI